MPNSITKSGKKSSPRSTAARPSPPSKSKPTKPAATTKSAKPQAAKKATVSRVSPTARKSVAGKATPRTPVSPSKPKASISPSKQKASVPMPKQRSAKPVAKVPAATRPSAAKKQKAALPLPSSAAKPVARKAAKDSASRSGAPIKSIAPAKVAAGKSASKTKPAPATKTSNAPTPAPVRQPTRDEAAALQAFERARKEFSRRNFSEARDLFRKLIEKFSGVAEVKARARTYLNIAETRLRAVKAMPKNSEELYDRGVVELNRGDYAAAQELFERALRRDTESPTAAHVYYGLAAARARLGTSETALASLAKALTLQPSLRARAQYDADLASLRSTPEFENLVAPTRG